MATQAHRQFDYEVNRLFAHRTDYLRHLVRRRSPGKPPTFNAKRLRRKIRLLQELAEVSIANSKFLRKEFSSLVQFRKRWHPRKGGRRGADSKRKGFDRFWQNRIGNRNFVYIFWQDRVCRYVGRTGAGRKRPQAHFSRPWFPRITRIDVDVAPYSYLPKLECLATHRFQPINNKIRPSARKWAKKCSICKVRKNVRTELKRIFRLR